MWCGLDAVTCSVEGGRLAELEREEVGVGEVEEEADGLVLEWFEGGVGFPGDRTLDFVADDFGAILEREVGDGGAIGILDFDLDGAGGGGGVVDIEFRAAERDGLCEECAAGVGGGDGGEAVGAEGIAADVGAGVAEVVIDVEGEFFGGGLDYSVGCVISA
ncbi:MAG: hypothetical protein RI897_3117 [Verrucomicrobiota bacterium]